MRLTEGASEERLEYLTESAEVDIAKLAALRSSVSVEVVAAPLAGIAKTLVRLVYLFEPVFRIRFVIAVRMILKCQPPKRLANLFVACVPVYAENLVVVASYLHLILVLNRSL